MSSRLSIDALLNPSASNDVNPTTRDALPILRQLATRIPRLSSLPVSPDTFNTLTALLQSIPVPASQASIGSAPATAVHPSLNTQSLPSTTRYNVRITTKTTLSKVLEYNDLDAYVELPECALQPVGYLFRQDPENWRNPMNDFAYSREEPSGRLQEGNTLDCFLLVDQETRGLVPCTERHYTCQGSKVCPQGNLTILTRMHTNASREDIKARLAMDRETRLRIRSPCSEVFRKTAALVTALRRGGCRSLDREVSEIVAANNPLVQHTQEYNKRIQKGFKESLPRCDSQILFRLDDEGKSFVMCEHYHHEANRDHFVMYLDDSYDTDYVEAVLEEDMEEVDRLEQVALQSGYGPLATCSTVTNVSSKRIVCPHDHRNPDGLLYQPEMERLPCSVKFRMYEPVKEYQSSCPYSLVVIKGEHPHPVPLPTRTPPRIRDALFDLFTKLAEDLADLTPRRFIRHPVTQAYLKACFPDVPTPVLSDIHPSLSNRAHIRTYIDQAKALWYPKGTGWPGAIHLRSLQQQMFPVEAQYIRTIVELDAATMGDASSNSAEIIQILICMTSEGSRRLSEARYIQCDIAFKRVVGYKEFELASFDPESNSSITFCRAFVTSESAETHVRLLEEIESLVVKDCGRALAWYHLHAEHPKDFHGKILLLTGDQHPGQAKGFGLHFQKLAQKMPNRFDFVQSDRRVMDLSWQEHLHRIFRTCEVHYFRKIRENNKVSEEVKNLMRGLACVAHNDFQGALSQIIEKGGKAGEDWVNNKLQNNFVFQGLCWQQSAIPLHVWRAGPRHTNVSEILHYDSNEEGRFCTLVGGIEKGRRLDALKLQSLKVYDDTSIRASYYAGHPAENALIFLRRKFNKKTRALQQQDDKIEAHNLKMEATHQELNQAHMALQALGDNASARQRATAEKALTRATKEYKTLKEIASQLEKGSGRVKILQQ